MKIMPNARLAMEYVNELTGIPGLVKDYGSRSGPGSIVFNVNLPNLPQLNPMTKVIDAITARLGDPHGHISVRRRKDDEARRGSDSLTNLFWSIDEKRRVRVRRTAFARNYFIIVLEDDNGETEELFDI